MIDKLLILGTKGMAKVAIDAIEESEMYSEIAFLDNYPDSDYLFSYPIIGKCDDLEKFSQSYSHAFVCVADNRTRMLFLQKLIAAGYHIPNIVHPRACVSRLATLGRGVFVNALAVIQPDSIIGNGCIINTGAVIEHDNKLGEYVNISPNASTTGYVKIDDYTFLGACSCVINNVHIGENVLVAAGATVITDIPDNVLVAGCPAIIKKSIDVLRYKKQQSYIINDSESKHTD